MIVTLSVYLVVAGAILGATLASYAGVVRSRGWRGSFQGRSRCDSCGAQLRWFELLPLLSFALQRGRCRSCGARIGRMAILIEGLGAAVGAAAGIAVVALLYH